MRVIPMVDLKRAHRRLQDPIEQALIKVARSAQFILGSTVESFETEFAQYLDPTGEVIGCNSGTDALLLTLLAMDFPPRSEVIVPDFTFVATVETIIRAGLTPVFADVDPDTYCLDPNSVKALIGPRTVAIIPVHLFGVSAPMEPLLQIARERRLKIIEDTAQATGAQYRFANGSIHKVGTIGDAGCFSFFPSKNLGGYGDGGAVFTRDPALGQRIRSLRNHGQRKRYYYDHIGINSRLDALQAAVLSVKLSYLDTFNRERQAVAHQYHSHMQSLGPLQLPVIPSYSTHVFHQYTLRVPASDRDSLISYLRGQGISAQVYYPMRISEHQPYQHYATTETPISKKLTSEVISLPIFPELKDHEIEYITSRVARYFT